MATHDDNILDAIDTTMFNLLDHFNNRMPLDLLGVIIKSVLLEKKQYITIKGKRISPNKYLKKNYKTFTAFIMSKTNYNIITENDKLYLHI